jgi:hypothetical protein
MLKFKDVVPGTQLMPGLWLAKPKVDNLDDC